MTIKQAVCKTQKEPRHEEPALRPLRNTAFHVLDDLILHGRAFSRAGQHYRERTTDRSLQRFSGHIAPLQKRRQRQWTKSRPPPRPPRSPLASAGPAHVLAASKQAVSMDDMSRYRSLMQHCRPQQDSLLDIAERGESTREHKRIMYRLATLVCATVFVLSFLGYGATLYYSRFWEIRKEDQRFQFPGYAHEVAAIGLVVELTVCIALGVRWRHYY